jgi:SAM-dependent methyltransferase
MSNRADEICMPSITTELERLKEQFNWNSSSYLENRDTVWYAKAEGRPISFPPEAYEACAELEDDSFWFAHRNQLIWKMIQRFNISEPLWDIGAGNGAVSAFLMSKQIQTVAVEPSPIGARNCARRGLHTSICGFLEDIHLPTASLNSIGSFDVIEHLNDPGSFLKECRRLLPPGKLFIVTVPAFETLWSETDAFAGHFCRFNRNSLRNLFLKSGFQERYSTYFFFPLVLPLWFLRVLRERLFKSDTETISRRAASHLKSYESKYLAELLRCVLTGEAAWLGRHPLPIGTSLLGVFESV